MESNIQDDLKQLLAALDNAYSRSDIKQYCQEHGKKWNYSLITSTLQKGGPLILGFNWGAAQDKSYDPQTEIKATNLEEEDLGSFKRIISNCNEYLGEGFLNKASQSNFCFFRSSKQSEISENDLELCYPIFNKLLEVIQPSVILCFSSKLRDYLLNTKEVSNTSFDDISFTRGKNKICYRVFKGKIGPKVDIYFLPHPNYPMKQDGRNKAWKFCFNGTAIS
jgi:ribonuclease R